MHQEGLIFPGTKIINRRAARPGDPRADPVQLAHARPRDRRLARPGRGAPHRRAPAQRAAPRSSAARRSTRRSGSSSRARRGADEGCAARATRRKAVDRDRLASTTTASATSRCEMQATVTIADELVHRRLRGLGPGTVGPGEHAVRRHARDVQGRRSRRSRRPTSRRTPATCGRSASRPSRATLFHAIYPAPTFTLWTGIVALELIFKALAQGMPDRLAASTGGDVPGFMMVGTHPDTEQMFAVSNNESSAGERRRRHDGANLDHPLLRGRRAQHADRGDRVEDDDVLRRASRSGRDSGGAGRHPRRRRAARARSASSATASSCRS